LLLSVVYIFQSVMTSLPIPAAQEFMRTISKACFCHPVEVTCRAGFLLRF
jgi:hypothetical protein